MIFIYSNFADNKCINYVSYRSESQVYVVSDGAADNLNAIDDSKTFETEADILAVLQQSSDGKGPYF